MTRPLLYSPTLARLLGEFRTSMRVLLGALCDELDSHDVGERGRARLPVEFFRLLVHTIPPSEFDHWKVVGWIESLNDLVYFRDIQRQVARERDLPDFAEQLLAECTETLYENSYLDELFPNRRPEPHRLAVRLDRFCARLSREIVQESLWLVPGLPCCWLAERGRRTWLVDGTLAANYERAEPAGAIAVGLDGTFVQAPIGSPRTGGNETTSVRFSVSPNTITARMRGADLVICTMEKDLEWHWNCHRPRYILEPDRRWHRGLTLGPTLVYDRHRVPVDIRPSPTMLIERTRRAVATIAQAWPEGHAVLSLLTSRIVPLRAKGVVSFSYRHRPGLSFINSFDRDQLDLIDDLIHENSHHHLNLLLRKSLLIQGDHNQEIFYSPWRRSLRPLRGILHATFTFTMGAVLFVRLSRFGRQQTGPWKKLGLSNRDLRRAHFRCLEEHQSVRYSLQDLAYADHDRGWLSASGRKLVRQLTMETAKLGRVAPALEKAILGTTHERALHRHQRELQSARQTYGPGRADKD